VELDTPTGPMRTHLFRPVSEAAFPGIVLFSEIYQVTAPIARLAAFLAGQGLIVSVPEIYHEYEAAGTALAYDKSGTDRGNELKYTKTVAAYDGDTRAALDHLASLGGCNGRLGAAGVCLGGHLAFRAALQPDVAASACFYPTDLHSASLGAGRHDDSLARASEISATLMLVFGRADPHVPFDGRQAIRARLEAAGTRYSWHELEAAHAFMRDEGPRYDPALAYLCQGLMIALFAGLK
jgi:carboxymethylenebutenolidase